MPVAARFFLLFDDQDSRAFNLMAECKLCGAMTEQPLALAWEMRYVQCSNCGVVMRLAEAILARLRDQAIAAQAAIDRLL